MVFLQGRAVPFTLSAEASTRSVEIREKGVHETFNCTSVQNTSDREAKAAVNFAHPVSLEFLTIHAPRKDAQKSGSPSVTAPVAELKPAKNGSLQNSGQVVEEEEEEEEVMEEEEEQEQEQEEEKDKRMVDRTKERKKE
ncbi:hypothetical protein PoB_004797400 [Plakobranchus ocellatus]|uniref:Uncharacterized protein n=1 Tax=Plakobranchus ocellatus TaxID=259542 RepID=A0AAV4BMX3_9GAST|nr:hypothetical protein PoB_004797400 [Plakobranchus ocellatus]